VQYRGSTTHPAWEKNSKRWSKNGQNHVPGVVSIAGHMEGD